MSATHTHRAVFKAGSRTYFNSTLFFPAEVRDDVSILYGFVRVADDFVDAVPQDGDGYHRYVDSYRKALDGARSGDVIIDSFIELARRKQFDPSWTDAFLRAMELDLTKSVYRTVDETLEYVYGSAEVIGLFMNRILGIDRAADDAARMQGRAMQFINFIRDIAEDNSFGRIYLPISETSMPDLREGTTRTHTAEFKRFLTAQLDRYRGWQRSAEEGYAFIPRRYLIPIKTASDMYNWTASVIEADPFVVYSRKVKPSRARILGQIARNAAELSVRGRGSSGANPGGGA